MTGEPDDVDAMVEPVVPSRHRWLAGLGAAAGDRVVDLGCGTGSSLAQVEAGLAVGVDASRAALARAVEALAPGPRYHPLRARPGRPQGPAPVRRRLGRPGPLP
jgi:SAM-dependent methyltransferase